MWSTFLRRVGIIAIATWRSKMVRKFVLTQSKKAAQKGLWDYVVSRREQQQEENAPTHTHSPTATRIPITFE